MGRSNNFLHPLHAPAQKCSASSCCGHIVIACADGISVHKPPVCFYLFFRWTLDLSCFHRSSGDAVSGHNTSPWLRAWCSCCSDALHGELLKSQPETQCKRGKVCTWDCPCPCWCHSYQVTVTVFLKKKNRAVLIELLTAVVLNAPATRPRKGFVYFSLSIPSYPLRKWKKLYSL